MKAKNKKIIPIILSCLAITGLAGCNQETQITSSLLRVSSLTSDSQNYETGSRINLTVVANTLKEDCTLKRVVIDYQKNNVDVDTKTCDVVLDSENPTTNPDSPVKVSFNYNVNGIFYKNDNNSQDFVVTEYVYSYGGEMYSEKANLKYTVFLKETDYTNVQLSVSDVSLVLFSSDEGEAQEISLFSLSNEGKTYSFFDSALDSTKIPAIKLKDITIDSNINKNTLKWIFKVTNGTGENETEEVFELQNLSVAETGDITMPLPNNELKATTKKIELIGAKFQLNRAKSEDFGKTFEKALTSTVLFLDIAETEIKISEVTVQTETSYVSKNGEFYLDARNFEYKNLKVTLKCNLRSGAEVASIKFLHNVGNSETTEGNEIEVAASKITSVAYPSYTALSFFLNLGKTGSHKISNFKIFGIGSDGAEKQLADSSKEAVINVIDAFVDTETKLKDGIAENNGGYFALTADFSVAVTSFLCDEFKGTIDGNGHKITLNFQSSAWFNKMTKTAKIKNLIVTSATLTMSTNNSSAIFCLENNGTIENVSIRGLEIRTPVSAEYEFKGIVVKNGLTGFMRNIEFNVQTLKYNAESVANEPKQITGICYENLGYIYSIYANYSKGTYWKALKGSAANLIVYKNYDGGKLYDIICDYKLNEKNQFNKVNLLTRFNMSTRSQDTQRLFYAASLIDDVELSTFTAISSPSGYNTFAEKIKAGQYLVLNNPTTPTLGVDWTPGREYILGFDARENISASGYFSSIKHCMYSEAIENVEFVQEANHNFGKYTTTNPTTFEEEKHEYTENAYVFTGYINGAYKVSHTEMHTASWLFSTNKNTGTWFDNELWTNTLSLKHSPSFEIKYV